MRSKTQLGKLITVEGIDGVGKNTQATLLHKYIEDVYGECGFFSFPRYESPTGKKVGDYLNGFGGDLNILQRAKLYTDDRLAAREEILDYLYRGYDVVCDRYVDSNIAFFTAMARLHNAQSNYPNEIKSHIETIEYVDNRLPKPDYTFVLLMSLENSQKLVNTKDARNYTDKKQDLHEGDKPLLEYANDYYKALGTTGFYQPKTSPLYQPRCVLPIDCGYVEGGVKNRVEIHHDMIFKLALRDFFPNLNCPKED